MAIKRTAQGKTIDMSALAAKHETMRAVSNMSMNARGDLVDSMGKVIESVTNKVNKAYVKTVGNRSAQESASNERVVSRAKPDTNINLDELNAIERELEVDEQDDVEIEQIKKQETKKK